MVGRAGLLLAVTAALLAAAPASAEAPAEGRLTVAVKYVRSNSMYTEGSVQYLVVKRGGEQVLRRQISRQTHRYLAVGRYWVSSYTRICDGNCGHLDPPTFRCARNVRVRGGEHIHATVRIRAGHRCSIDIARP